MDVLRGIHDLILSSKSHLEPVLNDSSLVACIVLNLDHSNPEALQLSLESLIVLLQHPNGAETFLGTLSFQESMTSLKKHSSQLDPKLLTLLKQAARLLDKQSESLRVNSDLVTVAFQDNEDVNIGEVSELLCSLKGVVSVAWDNGKALVSTTTTTCRMSIFCPS